MNVVFQHTPDEPVRFHEYANLFPMLQGEPLEALKQDIRDYGVREPIVFLDGAILDGRNRYMCARDLGIVYPRVEFVGSDPLSHVISHNLHRRHLNEAQRSMVAKKVSNMRRGERTDLEPSANLRKVSQADAAKLLNVSERSVWSAGKVHDQGAPELIDAVEQGDVSVSAAAEVSSLPELEQSEIVALGPAAVKEAAKDIREGRKPFVANNTGNNEWYTPERFIEAARTVLGRIDVDPASSGIANQTVQAEIYFSEDDDGLSQNWPEGRYWMNPPYAQPLMGKFAEKYALHMARGVQADTSSGIVLVNNATETNWFQQIAGVSSAVCFPKGRIKFIDQAGNASGAPLQGQAILYSGNHPDFFAEVFQEFGAVLWNG